MKAHPLFIFMLAGLCACSTAGGRPSGETAIPFVSGNGIAEWKVAGDDALYIKAINGDWYHVRTMGRCPRLRTALSLGFVTSGIDQLDRHGAIIAEGSAAPWQASSNPQPRPRSKADSGPEGR
jgi:hypothetical protein